MPLHGKRRPSELAPEAVSAFLNHLVVEGKVAASTQNQTLNALVFLSSGERLEQLGGLVRAHGPRPLSVFGAAQAAPSAMPGSELECTMELCSEARERHAEGLANLGHFDDIEPPLATFALAHERLLLIETARQLHLSDSRPVTRLAK